MPSLKSCLRKLFLGEWYKRYPTTESNFNFHYPEAKEWMWSSKRCINLGKFTGPDGYNYDLGVHKNTDGSVSYAIVYSNYPGDYISGRVSRSTVMGSYPRAETYKRWDKYKRRYLI